MAAKTYTVIGLLDCEFAIPAEAVVLVAGVVEGQAECVDTIRFSGPDERFMRLDRSFEAQSADAAARMFLESIHESLGNRPKLYAKSQKNVPAASSASPVSPAAPASPAGPAGPGSVTTPAETASTTKVATRASKRTRVA